MGRMSDEDLSRLLRGLPREEPSFDFTRKVLAKVDARSLRFRRSRGAVLAWAGAALLGVLLSQGYLRERYQRSRAAALASCHSDRCLPHSAAPASRFVRISEFA